MYANCNFTHIGYLLCIAGGASRDILLVGIDPPMAPPDHPMAPCEHGTVFAAVSGVSGDAAVSKPAAGPPVCAATQKEAGLHRAEVEVGEVRAVGGAEMWDIYNYICLGCESTTHLLHS